ncbi:MAG: AmmeMemoRadiSam system protein B [Deltaproteobacteria bacterium]|jgi:AmmeMemoRadiSam system protein B|nr:AmmeMemoRadiSam system protein B [Deltaproteobacteria bacterium]
MSVARIRRSQLDGTWYPAKYKEVESVVKDWDPYIKSNPPKFQGQALSIIVPHAGWYYSGRLAAKTIYQAAASLGPDGPALVVVLGGHLTPGSPPVIFSDQAWATPLGHIEIATELNEKISALNPRPWYGPSDDNTVEVQLPLLRLMCPKAKLWPLRLASGPGALRVGTILAEMAESVNLLIVASTDLTHYGSAYGFAPAGGGQAGQDFRQKNDQAFIEAALKPDPNAMMDIGESNRAACSAGAAAAAAEAAKIYKAKAELIDHYASSDIQPGNQAVGYAGLIYWRA